jgi:hypothetical protein
MAGHHPLNGRRRLILLATLVAAPVIAGGVVAVGEGPAAAPAQGDPVRTSEEPATLDGTEPRTDGRHPARHPRATGPSPTAAPAQAQLRRPEVPLAEPERLEIPAIGVDAPVIDLGLNADGTLEVPTDFDETGWWTGGPAPGEVGPAVIVGHVDSKDGPAVFFRLAELEPGDEIIVTSGDTRTTFTVESREQHPKDAFPTDRVYRDDDDRVALRLITCGGEFNRSTGHYRDNVVIYAGLAEDI